MEIQTARLRLFALNNIQLQWLKAGRETMEQRLGLTPSSLQADRDISAEIEEALDFWLQFSEQHPSDFFWGTNWEIIHKEENCSVGGIGMGGAPNKDGLVTVGYHIDTRRQGKGFATEALCALRDWALQQPNCKGMVAFTPVDNTLSQRVLSKAAFQNVGRVEEDGILCYRWEYR